MYVCSLYSYLVFMESKRMHLIPVTGIIDDCKPSCSWQDLDL